MFKVIIDKIQFLSPHMNRLNVVEVKMVRIEEMKNLWLGIFDNYTHLW